MDKIWKSTSIHKKLKLEVLKTCVFSGMLYGCEAWTITKVAEAKIIAFERKCYRKILRIGWMQKVTNAELYRRIDLTENLMQKIITRKLELFGHICRMENDRKIKSIAFGRLDGTNKRGRPHTEWMDNITDCMVWCINTRTIPRCFGETKMASNNENGIGHLRALVPWLMMMMMIKSHSVGMLAFSY